jgi:hypothetical protein
MADPNYIRRIQDIRRRNVEARAKGKPLIFQETEMLDLILRNKIPTQMQHCIIKVQPKMQGSQHERFLSAFNICAAVFIKYGYQQSRSTVLTGKGMRNNLQHRREPDAGWKAQRYQWMVGNLWRGYLDRRQKELTKQR